MTVPERRLDARIIASIPIEIRWGRKIRPIYFTEDVSARGLFVYAEEAPPLRELVHMTLTVRATGERVTLHGLVAHVVKPGGQQTPGFGIHFYAVDSATNALWRSFLRGFGPQEAAADASS